MLSHEVNVVLTLLDTLTPGVAIAQSIVCEILNQLAKW